MPTKQPQNKVDEIKTAASDEITKIRHEMEKAMNKVEHYAKTNPGHAAAISAGIGTVIGAAIATLIGVGVANRKKGKKK